MGSGQNVVQQRIKLDTGQYSTQYRRMVSDTKTGVASMNRDLQSSGSAWQDYANQVKQRGASISKTAQEIGKSFAQYVGKGALVMGGVAAVSQFTRSVQSTKEVGLEFGKALAQMGQRADLTGDKLDKLRKRFYDLGKNTGASLQSLPAAGSSLLGAVGGNADRAMEILEPIAKAAGAENGDAASLTESVKSILKGEGRGLTKDNVQELLHSGFIAKSGGDFASMDEYMQARLAGVQGVAGRAHLTDRDQASILGAATQTGMDKDSSIAGIQALIRSSVTGLGGGAALAGLLGVHGGFLTHGKFDVTKLNEASAHLGKSGMGEADFVKLLQSGGLNDKESQGVYSLLKGNGDFQSRVKKIQSTSKSFDQAVSESTDDVSDDLRKLQNQIVGATDQIFSPAGRVIKAGMRGGLLSAGEAVPSAVADSLKAINDNKGLVAGGLAMSAISGMLSKKLGLFGGIMVGQKLKEQGVTPVYVTNAGEIGEKSGGVEDFLAKTAEISGGAAVGGTAATAGAGLLATLGIPALGIAGAGAAGFGVGKLLDKGIDKITGGEGLGGKVYDWTHSDTVEHKVTVEVKSKDPAFTAIPKSTDKATNARGP